MREEGARHASRILVIFVSLVACGRAEFVDPPQSANVDFARAELVLQENCTGCHSPEHGNAAGLDLSNFDSLRPHLQAIEAQISTDNMPLGGPPLSESDKNLLFSWIKMGGPKGADNAH